MYKEADKFSNWKRQEINLKKENLNHEKWFDIHDNDLDTIHHIYT